MLLPAIAFQLILLCPHSSHQHFSLPPPHSPHWYSLVLAVALVAGATVRFLFFIIIIYFFVHHSQFIII